MAQTTGRPNTGEHFAPASAGAPPHAPTTTTTTTTTTASPTAGAPTGATTPGGAAVAPATAPGSTCAPVRHRDFFVPAGRSSLGGHRVGFRSAVARRGLMSLRADAPPGARVAFRLDGRLVGRRSRSTLPTARLSRARAHRLTIRISDGAHAVTFVEPLAYRGVALRCPR